MTSIVTASRIEIASDAMATGTTIVIADPPSELAANMTVSERTTKSSASVSVDPTKTFCSIAALPRRAWDQRRGSRMRCNTAGGSARHRGRGAMPIIGKFQVELLAAVDRGAEFAK